MEGLIDTRYIGMKAGLILPGMWTLLFSTKKSFSWIFKLQFDILNNCEIHLLHMLYFLKCSYLYNTIIVIDMTFLGKCAVYKMKSHLQEPNQIRLSGNWLSSVEVINSTREPWVSLPLKSRLKAQNSRGTVVIIFSHKGSVTQVKLSLWT